MALQHALMLLAFSLATFARVGFGQPEIAVRKSDLPFIKCDVCKTMVKQLMVQLEREKEKAEPKKVPELKVIEIAEKLCDVKTPNGGWINRIDIVKSGHKLFFIEHDEDGECLSECKTIERSCQDIMGYLDTDLAEKLYHGAQESDIYNFLCLRQSDACTSTPPPLPEGYEAGEEWVKHEDRPVDYSALAKEHGLKSSVMHDEATISNIKMPKGMGVPEEVAKRAAAQKKASAEKPVREAKKGKKKAAAGAGDMGDVLAQAQKVAAEGPAAATEFVHKMTGKSEGSAPTYDEL